MPSRTLYLWKRASGLASNPSWTSSPGSATPSSTTPWLVEPSSPRIHAAPSRSTGDSILDDTYIDARYDEDEEFSVNNRLLSGPKVDKPTKKAKKAKKVPKKKKSISKPRGGRGASRRDYRDRRDYRERRRPPERHRQREESDYYDDSDGGGGYDEEPSRKRGRKESYRPKYRRGRGRGGRRR
jgi:hypothetical protein